MKPLRLVLITRRFWPLVGGAEQVMSNLASQLQSTGHSVQLLTARWEKHWPHQFVHREIPVTRLTHPAARGWGTLRYMRAVARWLKQHREEFDAVLVSMLKHDAYAAIGALRKSAQPVIIRAEGGGASGDCRWHEQGRFGRRIRAKCESADALIAPSPMIADELAAVGFDRHRIHYIPNGVKLCGQWSRQRQIEARETLLDAHEVMHLESNIPLAVYTGRLHENKGLLDLVNSWPTVLFQRPKAKLWLVGEGPDAPRLWDRIRRLGLTQQIILPGSFDEITEVLHAADVFVLPSYEEGMSLSLLEAMAAGLPTVASDIPGNRQLIEDGVHGRLFPPRDVPALSKAILDVLKESNSARTMAENARARVENEYSLQRMTDHHIQVIRRSIDEKTQRQRRLR